MLLFIYAHASVHIKTTRILLLFFGVNNFLYSWDSLFIPNLKKLKKKNQMLF